MFLKFLTFLLIFHITNEFVFASANCEYSIDKRSVYKCNLNVKNIEDNEEIVGIHIDGRSDDDIKIIAAKSKSNSSNFPSEVCQKFHNLQTINLVGISIQNVDENSLRNCQSLKILNLADNKILKIPENFFAENSNLIEIDLSQNKLNNLDDNLFRNSQNLENLKLQKNKLSHLPGSIFKPLKNLKSLTLTYNEIKVLNPEWFSDLPNLHQLFLSFNKIEDLPPGIFTHLTNLKSLDLSVNNLTTIHSDSFGQLPNLNELYLEYNNIISIDKNVIENTGISIIDLGFGDRNVKVNLCANKNFRDMTRSRIQLMSGLKKCFDNYQLRG